MTNRPLVVVDLPVVAARERLVAEEMDVLVVNAGETLGGVFLGFDVPQAVRLVPSGGEAVERDLAAY